MKYFQSVTTLEELKKEYRKLALKFHPDRGGNEQEFISLKKEYDKIFAKLNKTDEVNDTCRNIIDAFIKYDIDIEIIGTWVWIQGNTFSIKEKLKEWDFKWSKKKQAWYWHDGEYKKKSRKNYSLDEIREMHNSKKIKSGSRKFALNA